jgi:hypothetical protein
MAYIATFGSLFWLLKAIAVPPMRPEINPQNREVMKTLVPG